jgi:tripartite-type tricarboxylate transporter receptor subunit TctC
MTLINAISRALARADEPGLGECQQRVHARLPTRYARAHIKWPRWPLASLASAASCAALLLAAAAQAQSPAYPDHPVKIIVPFPAAGPTDVVARLIAQKLSDKWGHQFYIENMSGAGGNLGMGAAARAPADGYTILFVSSSYTVNPSLYAKAPYDPDRDFAPVTKAAGSPNGLFVHPSIPAKSVMELVELLRANPGKYTFASPGIGTTPHLSSELFKLTFKLDFALAPFPGGAPSIQSVVAGHTPMCIQAIPPATPLVKDGKLRALGITAKARSPALPDVPTFDEVGIKDQEAETMQGVLVPAGTPKPIVDLLQAEIARIVSLPDVKEKMLAIGLEPSGMSSAEFAAYIKDDLAKWKKVIIDAKIPQIGG